MEQPTLVIVEDDLLLALALTALVEDLGYRVLATADTQQGAVQVVRERRPDLVLMDIKLMNGDGLSAAIEIRQSSKVPIIFCTSYDKKGVQSAVRALGNTALIGKPFDETELADLLVNAVKKSGMSEYAKLSLVAC
jgi:CheY-like chemotaxis protein